MIDLNTLIKINTILLLETMALLHDIGKLSSSFLQAKAIDNSQEDIHALLPLKDNIPRCLSQVITLPQNYPQKIAVSFNPLNIICSHHGCDRCLRNCQDRQNNHLITLLRAADQQASEEEKGFLKDSGRQPFQQTYFSNPFGQESLINTLTIDQQRKNIWKNLNGLSSGLNVPAYRKQAFKIIKPIFSQFPSETRRPSNDLTLWDHSFTVATYFKIALHEVFMQGKNPKSLSHIPVLFVKYKKPPITITRHIEEITCSGNLLFSLGDCKIFAVNKEYISKHQSSKMSISDCLVDLLPDIKEMIALPKIKKFPALITADYRHLSSSLPKASFIQPITQKHQYEVKNQIKMIVYLNYLQTKKKVNNKINSINQHLNNLKKGNSAGEKTHELHLKIKEVNLLNAILLDLESVKKLLVLEETTNFTQEAFREIPISDLYRQWVKTNTRLDLLDIFTYYLWQRNPSVSSSLAVIREIEKLQIKLGKFLRGLGFSIRYQKGKLFLSRDLSPRELILVKELINAHIGKGLGLISLHLHRFGKNSLASKKPTLVKIGWKSLVYESGQIFMEVLLRTGQKLKIPLTDGQGNIDEYRLYYQLAKGDMVHLSEMPLEVPLKWQISLNLT